jgi:hypothetical protein
MPDTFASAFAGEFYKRILLKGKYSPDLSANIGEALYETRLHFLEACNNPLGMGYGLYAISNQQLCLSD